MRLFRPFALGLCLLSGVLHAGPRKDMSAYAFRDTQDSVVTLAQFKGDYVLLEIWSMSCRPCLVQMPFFENLARQYQGRHIQFLSVCVENNAPLWKDFLAKRHIGGTQLITPIGSPFLEDNRFYAVPRFVLIDKKGQLVSGNAGLPSDPALKKDLDRYLTM